MRMGQLINQRREELGLSQAMLAEKLQCKPQAISDVESGRVRAMQRRFWPKLAEALKVPMPAIVAAARESQAHAVPMPRAAKRLETHAAPAGVSDQEIRQLLSRMTPQQRKKFGLKG